jgi:hypothetical protein
MPRFLNTDEAYLHSDISMVDKYKPMKQPTRVLEKAPIVPFDSGLTFVGSLGSEVWNFSFQITSSH